MDKCYVFLCIIVHVVHQYLNVCESYVQDSVTLTLVNVKLSLTMIMLQVDATCQFRVTNRRECLYHIFVIN